MSNFTLAAILCFLVSLGISAIVFFSTRSIWTEFNTLEQLVCFSVPLLMFGAMLLGTLAAFREKK